MVLVKVENRISNRGDYYQNLGLLFECEEDYQILKNIDKNINYIVRLVKNGEIDIKDVFENLKVITVEETYPDAYDDLDRLFINVTSLLIYEDIPNSVEYKIGCKFFDKINVIEYVNSIDGVL